MKLLIVVQHRFRLWAPPPWFAPRLQAEFPGVEVRQFSEYAQAEPHIPDAEALMTWSLRAEQFAQAKRLRWIHSPAAAVHALMIPEIIAGNVMVTKSSAVHGPVVAEHVMALLLALARRIPASIFYQQQRTWAQEQIATEPPVPRELHQATLALVGVGGIGREVAVRALAFGMRVLAVREHSERGIDFLPDALAAAKPPVVVAGIDALDEVLPQADFVVLCAPVTGATNRMISAERLRRMNCESYLVNVSRGALVDENALAAALGNRQLAGAALDVFEQEPLPADSPLWCAPNLLITPHSAAFTRKMWERHYALFAENLRRYQAGTSLLGLVDKRKGY